MFAFTHAQHAYLDALRHAPIMWPGIFTPSWVIVTPNADDLSGWNFEVGDGSVAYLQEDRRWRCQRVRAREMPGLLVPPERIG
eukprot:8258533-Lingulodinium_polyedra.AAC.1